MKDESGKRERSQLALASARGLIDSRRLFYFYHVARAGSFTAAEPNLDVAQPALTRQIKQLEIDLGVQLFQRDGRGARLTDVGQILYGKAEAILAEMSQTRDELQLASRRPTGRIRIAAPPMFTSRYMAPVIQRFLELSPDAMISATEASTRNVYNLLTNGDVDCAVVLLSANSGKLRLQKLMNEPLLVVAGPQHSIADRANVTRSELLELDVVLPVSGHGTRALLAHYLGDSESQLVPRVEADSLALTKALLRSGRYVGIIPRSACQDEVAAGTLVARPLQPMLERILYLATLRDRPPTPLLSSFMRLIRSVIKETERAEDSAAS